MGKLAHRVRRRRWPVWGFCGEETSCPPKREKPDTGQILRLCGGLEACRRVLPLPASRRRRRWGWWRRRWRTPVMRRRRWRWWHTPAMPMMMVVGDAAGFVSSRLRHCRPCECDCGKRRDYLHLVHVVIPFFVCGCVFSSDRRADKPAYESAKERSPDFAPVLRVESAVVMMLRFVMPCRRRRSRSVAHYLMPRIVL